MSKGPGEDPNAPGTGRSRDSGSKPAWRHQLHTYWWAGRTAAVTSVLCSRQQCSAYLRRLNDGQVWRADSTVTARPAAPGEAGTR
jgi:hypothetical protein